jgi:hypothetical protein
MRQNRITDPFDNLSDILPGRLPRRLVEIAAEEEILFSVQAWFIWLNLSCGCETARANEDVHICAPLHEAFRLSRC